MRFAVDVTQIHIDALCYIIVLERENLFILIHLHIQNVRYYF